MENEFIAWKTTTDRLRAIHLKTGVVFDKVGAHVEFEKDRKILGVEYQGDSDQLDSLKEKLVCPP